MRRRALTLAIGVALTGCGSYPERQHERGDPVGAPTTGTRAPAYERLGEDVAALPRALTQSRWAVDQPLSVFLAMTVLLLIALVLGIFTVRHALRSRLR